MIKKTEDNTNIYTTKTERSMRTTNQRINVGLWSDEGALNVCKIRGAYYYNEISPLNWKKEVKIHEIQGIIRKLYKIQRIKLKIPDKFASGEKLTIPFS